MTTLTAPLSIINTLRSHELWDIDGNLTGGLRFDAPLHNGHNDRNTRKRQRVLVAVIWRRRFACKNAEQLTEPFTQLLRLRR